MTEAIIQTWEQEQLNDSDQPLFFTVRFRTSLTDWQNFKEAPKERRSGFLYWQNYTFDPGQRLSFTTLEAAQDLAREQSGVYIDSLVGVFVGDSNIILSLWDDGKCLYDNPMNSRYIGKDYERMWR